MQSAVARQNFIDWMKAIGMLLIVAGHVIGDPNAAFNQLSLPANTKQLGVAFFVFISGWGLANVSKATWYTVYKRIFSLFAYGIAFAVFFSVMFYYLYGTLQLSNYTPFVFGANVLFNDFPANSTTWYIGTYLHLVLLWFCVTRHLHVRISTLCVAFILENVVRGTLISADMSFIAYMLFPNWLSVFLLGHYLCNKADETSLNIAIITGVVWVLIAAAWSAAMRMFTIEGSLPFNHIILGDTWTVPLQSLLVSTIYLLSTWLFFQFTRRLPANRVAQFFSRNTIVVFIIHLPVIYAFFPTWYRWLEGPLFEYRRVSLILMVYIVSAVISELVTRLLRLERFREPLWLGFHKKIHGQLPTMPRDDDHR
ncbi:acyltransferase family protein [Alteromonas sp. H39]|uniref:acyltransferase family protein n=1 Tax=Alteromonas sp. H39 TaxID=3389876 RepID=UPI0039E087B9